MHYRYLHTCSKEIFKELLIRAECIIAVGNCTTRLQSLTNSLKSLFLSQNQSHQTIKSIVSVIVSRRRMNICIGRNKQSFLMSPVYNTRIELISIHHFNTIYETFCIHGSLRWRIVDICSLPAWMIMHDQCVLSLSITHGLYRIWIIDQIIVSCKKRIEMTHSLAISSNLGTWNNKQTIFLRISVRLLATEVKIH